MTCTKRSSRTVLYKLPFPCFHVVFLLTAAQYSHCCGRSHAKNFLGPSLKAHIKKNVVLSIPSNKINSSFWQGYLCKHSVLSCQSVSLWIISSERSNTGPVNIVLCGSDLSLSLFMIFRLGRGLKIGDILKDDEVLTAFLLRDAGFSESIVYQLVNAQIRLEQVKLHSRLSHLGFCTEAKMWCIWTKKTCVFLKMEWITLSWTHSGLSYLFIFSSLHLASQTCSWRT